MNGDGQRYHTTFHLSYFDKEMVRPFVQQLAINSQWIWQSLKTIDTLHITLAVMFKSFEHKPIGDDGLLMCLNALSVIFCGRFIKNSFKRFAYICVEPFGYHKITRGTENRCHHYNSMTFVLFKFIYSNLIDEWTLNILVTIKESHKMDINLWAM